MTFSPFRSACAALGLAWALTAAAAVPAPPVTSAAMPPKLPLSQLVDVNNASREALLKLPGITPALADQIISHRPYLSKAKLVTRKAIPLATFQLIRDHIMTLPPAKK